MEMLGNFELVGCFAQTISGWAGGFEPPNGGIKSLRYAPSELALSLPAALAAPGLL
jgi:hypothetical protein